MDTKLSNAASERISALFRGRNHKEDISFEDKNRSKELKRLAKSMEMDVPKLKEFLGTESSKMDDKSSDAAQYVDWVANHSKSSEGGDTASHKRSNNGNSQDTSKKPRKENENSSANAPGPSDAAGKKGKGKGRPARKRSPEDEEEKKTEPRSNGEEEKSTNEIQKVANNPTSAIVDKTLLSDIAFSTLDNLHPATKRALSETLGLQYMTEIQAKTYAAASAGKDVLGRARTGTGKTLAFLLPSLERILNHKNLHQPGKNVGILIISPTRELATQIGDQAEKLLTFHKEVKVQVIFGGTNMGRDVSSLNRRIPSVLVATPGRLLDHLENTVLKGKKFGREIMQETPILVLDETDRLLDMGFRRDIEKILAYLPSKERRQTLLFSATVPKELKQIMSENMRNDFVEADCIHDKAGQHTNAQVEQSHVVLPSMDRYVTSVVEIVQQAMKADPDDHKIVVFFPTARVVGFFADFFNVGLRKEVIEIHSRKNQAQRNKASDKFRNAKRGVLFTSDVSARGVDYPDVTSVIQFGLPDSRESYIHRLGRTGRAGKSGQGLLVLAPFETKFLSELKGLDVPQNSQVAGLLQGPVDKQVMASIADVLDRVKNGDSTLTKSAEQAYRAFLGYYVGQMRRITINSKAEVVDVANYYSTLMGLTEIPGLEARTVGKMGLKGVAGVRIVKAVQKQGGMKPRGGRKNYA